MHRVDRMVMTEEKGTQSGKCKVVKRQGVRKEMSSRKREWYKEGEEKEKFSMQAAKKDVIRSEGGIEREYEKIIREL